PLAEQRDELTLAADHYLTEARRFFTPLGVRIPKLATNVGQLDPGVDQNSVAMASLDERLNVAVALGVGIIIMPRSHLQRRDAGCPPARGEIIEINAHAVGV